MSLIDKLCVFCNKRQSLQGDYLESDATPSSIYEAVRSEVKRAISDIQSDLESVGVSGLMSITSLDIFSFGGFVFKCQLSSF